MQYGGELYHYGKLGMKWGRRKYQDKYGGLNNAGQKRVKQLVSENDRLSNVGRLSSNGARKKADLEKEYSNLTGRLIADHPLQRREPVKSLKEMTNEELTAYNTRQILERTYQSFQPQQQAPQISKGKQFLSGLATKIIIPAATDTGKKWALEKFGELSMSPAAQAERDFNSAYERAKKNNDIDMKRATIKKMKYDIEDRDRDRALGIVRPPTDDDPLKVKT